MTQPPKVLAVIPARYASSRFPGKPLVSIQGKPMIQHVVERAQKVPLISRVIVATDDPRIEEAVKTFGGDVVMTSLHHASGTDRVWEVAQAYPDFEIIMNIQGDEPFINPLTLEAAIRFLIQQPEAGIVTLITPIRSDAEWQDPNIVKAIPTESGKVLYFSRASIPYVRENIGETPSIAFRHLGLYLFRRAELQRFTSLSPSPLEQLEKLEQLRALENGIAIYATVVEEAPIGIDTPEDLVRLENSLCL
jgi:3-deoxy-manno-octulosonate cytidylyltransferase (CMP-KDO synthetase)